MLLDQVADQILQLEPSVTARLLTLGQYAASGDGNIILNATSPNGARDMFRGGGRTIDRDEQKIALQARAHDASFTRPAALAVCHLTHSQEVHCIDERSYLYLS